MGQGTSAEEMEMADSTIVGKRFKPFTLLINLVIVALLFGFVMLRLGWFLDDSDSYSAASEHSPQSQRNDYGAQSQDNYYNQPQQPIPQTDLNNPQVENYTPQSGGTDLTSSSFQFDGPGTAHVHRFWHDDDVILRWTALTVLAYDELDASELNYEIESAENRAGRFQIKNGVTYKHWIEDDNMWEQISFELNVISATEARSLATWVRDLPETRKKDQFINVAGPGDYYLSFNDTSESLTKRGYYRID